MVEMDIKGIGSAGLNFKAQGQGSLTFGIDHQGALQVYLNVGGIGHIFNTGRLDCDLLHGGKIRYQICSLVDLEQLGQSQINHTAVRNIHLALILEF